MTKVHNEAIMCARPVIVFILYIAATGTADEEAIDARAVIASTLHSTHADLVSKLNFSLLYPELNQAGVVPVDSLPHLLRPLVPDHRAAQVNNLIIWLQSCNLEQFRRFISLLRATAGEGGAAHEELADVLEEKFEKFYNTYEPPGVCKTGIYTGYFIKPILRQSGCP